MSRLRKILCNLFGWHKPNYCITVSGINLKSICRYCGKPIMRDTQGNWFERMMADNER